MINGRDIKSTAVVKYHAAKAPSTFQQLDEQTDLNAPPGNWLRGNFAASEPWVPGSATAGKREYSSLLMVKNSIDMIGKVDVVSNSENIKKLLKMPYSKAPISMVVHRIGRTVMIDDFDIYKRVLRQQQADWQWLSRFISEHIIMPEDRKSMQDQLVPACLPPATREQIEEKLMLSKFLYHSIATESDESATSEKQLGSPGRSRDRFARVPDPLQSDVPGPSLDSASTFERQVVWTFEDIRMLIGSDMPIFGGGTHPCVSLQLRDMQKPITVLTGLDYWLDQLMCNVPEVLMCYHLEGFVQKYEIIKTEELPDLSETPFSAELIRDVAKNILAFLKSKATKEGHTYWLFKEKDDDLVKLYDLTTICADSNNMDDSTNPYALPVAMLMYRVAKNLAEKNSMNPRKTANTIYKLLNNSLELLDKEKHPQVGGSIQYLLANLYLSCEKHGSLSGDGTGDDGVNVDDDFDPDDWPMDDAKQPESHSCVSLEVLMRPAPEGTDDTSSSGQGTDAGGKGAPSSQSRSNFVPNLSNLEDMCTQTLEHVYQGLVLAEVPVCGDVTGTERGEPATANPDDAIPMHAKPVIGSRNSIETALLPLPVRSPREPNWRVDLTALLLVKAMHSYKLLAECSIKLQNYGKCLKNLRLANCCYEGCCSLIRSVTSKTRSRILCEEEVEKLVPDIYTLSGDCHTKLAHIPMGYIKLQRAEFLKQSFRDGSIRKKAQKFIEEESSSSSFDTSELFELSGSIEEHLKMALKCYEAAMRKLYEVADLEPDVAKVQSYLSKGGSGRGLAGSAGTSASIPAEDETARMERVLLEIIILSKRIGNAKNELGIYFMNLPDTLLAAGNKSDVQKDGKIQACWEKSYTYLQEGILIFSKINDMPNVALLNANCGRLMRTCANAYYEENLEISSEERQYMLEALEMYHKALEAADAKEHVMVWESVVWELSSTYFALGQMLQERPPLSMQKAEEVERDIAENMHKALRFVEALVAHQPSFPRHDTYVYRVGLIHHKLASMYHRSYRATEAMERRHKQVNKLAEMHYAKAAETYKEILDSAVLDFIGVVLERVSMVEFNAENAQGASSKLKAHHQAVTFLLTCRSAFMSLCRTLPKREIRHLKRSLSPPESMTSERSFALDDLTAKSGAGGGSEELRLNRASPANGDSSSGSDKCRGRTSTKPDPRSSSKPSGEAELDGSQKEFEDYVVEVDKLCKLCLSRLQANIKSILLLLRGGKKSSGSDESAMTVYKKAYAQTLIKAPSDPVDFPSCLLKLADGLYQHGVWPST